MSGYILIFIWLGFISCIVSKKKCTREETKDGITTKRMIPSFAILVFLPIIVWAGFRSGRGYADTNAYIYTYSVLPNDFSGLIQYISYIEKDKGFYFYSGIIKLIFGSPYTPYLLSIAIIQGGIIIWFFRTYSSDYLISIFLFLATGEYLAWMFNGIRQFLAVVIVLTATPLVIKKKYFPSLLIILLASTIHQTALIMIPIFLIAQGKPWNRKTIVLLLFVIAALFSADKFTNILGSALSETQYSENINMIKNGLDDGVNPVRVLVYSVPAILSFFGRKEIAKQNDIVINICVNMSIVSSALYLIAMVTSGIMLGRLPIYVSLYGFILLPYEINLLFSDDSKRKVKAIMIIMFLLYYYYLMHFSFGKI